MLTGTRLEVAWSQPGAKATSSLALASSRLALEYAAPFHCSYFYPFSGVKF